MEAVILQLIKAENPELCRSIMRNFLTQSRFKITSPYAQLIYARGTSGHPARCTAHKIPTKGIHQIRSLVMSI